MKLKDLKTNPQNPRYLTEADFQKLLNKLLTFPRLLEKNKITFDSEQGNTILGGNMRFKALNYICDTYTRESIFDAVKTAQNSLNVDNADLIEESVTVFTRMIEKRSLPKNWVQDARGLSEEEKQAFIVIDNVSDGKWDFDALANNWDIDFEAWGLVDWKTEDDSDIELQAKEDDYKEPDELKVDVVLGDLIEIGEHRLLCGDSTDSDQLAKLMNGEKADLMVTDPPYGIDLNTDYSSMGATTTKYEKIKGDEKEFNLTDVISISGTKEQYIWGGDYFVNSLDWISGTQIIWAKRHSEEENKVFGSAFESLWVSYKCKKAIWFIRPINQSSERLGQHPTQKPIECMSRCINMSKLKGCIYDAFLGSGSTMVAAHQLKRKCYGMELEPKYCQVIIDRMIKLDPSLIVKINGKEYKK